MPETGRITGHSSTVTDPLPIGRDELVAISAPVIRRLSKRVTASRFRPRRSDEAYLEFVRQLTSLLEVYVSIAPPGDPLTAPAPGGLAHA